MVTELRRIAPEAAAHLQQFIIPIFSQRSDGLRQVASGFLVERGGQSYLVSAAHVLDALEDASQRLSIFIEPGLVWGLTGDCLTTPCPSGRRSDDHVDVGVLRLRSQKLPPFDSLGKRCMSSAMLPTIEGSNEQDAPYLMIGFPASKGEVDRRERSQISAYWPIIIGGAKIRDYEREGLSASSHILMPWNKRKVYDLEKKKINPSTFPGMSGCPIFSVATDDNEKGFIVAGIFIEHRKSSNILVATRAAQALSLIEAIEQN